MTRPLILFFVFVVSLYSYSQNKEFDYWTALCTCKGTYDSTKVAKIQLKNTFDYLWWAPNIENDGTAWTLDKIKELSVKELKNECFEKINRLRTIDFVEDEFWSRLKEERIKYYESTCELREITILAYSNPDTLLYYDKVDSITMFYRDLLIEGGQLLIDEWVNHMTIRLSKQAYNERNTKKFEKEYNSPLREDYARLELMMFGWWNNANRNIFHINTSYDFEFEFERLLQNTNCECDEP